MILDSSHSLSENNSLDGLIDSSKYNDLVQKTPLNE